MCAGAFALLQVVDTSCTPTTILRLQHRAPDRRYSGFESRWEQNRSGKWNCGLSIVSPIFNDSFRNILLGISHC